MKIKHSNQEFERKVTNLAKKAFLNALSFYLLLVLTELIYTTLQCAISA